MSHNAEVTALECRRCALRAAIDLLAEAQRDTERWRDLAQPHAELRERIQIVIDNSPDTENAVTLLGYKTLVDGLLRDCLAALARPASAPAGDSEHGLIDPDAAYQVLGHADATASEPSESEPRCSGHVWMALDGYPAQCSVCGAQRRASPASAVDARLLRSLERPAVAAFVFHRDGGGTMVPLWPEGTAADDETRRVIAGFVRVASDSSLAELRAENARLRERVAELEWQLADADATGILREMLRARLSGETR